MNKLMMTIKLSTNLAQALQSAIMQYNKELTDLWMSCDDDDQANRIEQCIWDLEALYDIIGKEIDEE